MLFCESLNRCNLLRMNMHEYIFHKTIATISLIGKTLRSIYAQRNHSGHLSMRGPMLLTKWSCWKKITRLSNEVCIIERKDSAARICERYFLFCHSPSVDRSPLPFVQPEGLFVPPPFLISWWVQQHLHWGPTCPRHQGESTPFPHVLTILYPPKLLD